MIICRRRRPRRRADRRRRIAAGSGTDLQEVNRLLKQFEQTRKMMYQMTGGRMQQMMARMKR